MAKKKLTKEQEKEIKLLQANNEMFERTLEEAKLRGNENSIKRIELARQDVIEQISKIDSTLAKKIVSKTENDIITKPNVEIKDDSDSIFKLLDEYNGDARDKEPEPEYGRYDDSKVENDDEGMNQGNSFVFNTDFNDVDSNMQYDVISLPSNGECYKSKTPRIPVAYLTAYDENFITSPNLYKDGLVIDFLLKHKVMNKNIDIDSLCSGDVDAIVLFLRATSYGTEFPIVVKDPKTGEEIESVVDLSSLKSKDFKLKGDENGYFDFELPVSKDKIKFRFLTRNDERKLKFLNSIEGSGIKGNTIINNANNIIESIKADNVLEGKKKQEFIGYLNGIKEWGNELISKHNITYNKMVTNRLKLSIMSINGETSKEFISKYVDNMIARDSLMLRRYIINNEPGINFEIEVKRPESLGGGSFKTFLEWDDSVFLNIA